jgi:hypothetical protein
MGTKIKYVPHIPDLMEWEDYETVDEKKVVRVQLRVTDEGVEIIGDSPYPHLLEELLAGIDPKELEMMLCG